jgi:hypothetical protein
MRFDWDEKKNASNRTKHRIAFEEAITLFDDPSVNRGIFID